MFGPAGPNGYQSVSGSLGARTSAGVRSRGREALPWFTQQRRPRKPRSRPRSGASPEVRAPRAAVPRDGRAGSTTPGAPSSAAGWSPATSRSRSTSRASTATRRVLEDLEQVATLGLIQAIDHFQEARPAARTSCPSRSPPSTARCSGTSGTRPGSSACRGSTASCRPASTRPSPTSASASAGPRAPRRSRPGSGSRSMRSSTGCRCNTPDTACRSTSRPA